MGFQLWERATCDVCGCAAPDVRLEDLRQTRILPVGWSTYDSHTMVTEHRGERKERVMCGKCVASLETALAALRRVEPAQPDHAPLMPRRRGGT